MLITMTGLGDDLMSFRSGGITSATLTYRTGIPCSAVLASINPIQCKPSWKFTNEMEKLVKHEKWSHVASAISRDRETIDFWYNPSEVLSIYAVQLENSGTTDPMYLIKLNFKLDQQTLYVTKDVYEDICACVAETDIRYGHNYKGT